MSRSDVYLYIDANDPADAVIASKTSTTAATFPTLVLGDTPTFNFYFTDGTNFASWAGDAGYSVTWALSDAIAGDQAPLALQTASSIITGGWSMVLPINTGALVNDLQSRRVSQAWPVVQLWSHIRITDDAGGLVSYAMIRTNVRLRAIGDTQTTPDDPLPAGTQFVLADETGALSSPANFLDASGFVTLDGGGKVPASQLPDIALVDYLGTAASEAAMLALDGQLGDWCIRTDLSTSWIITGADPTLLAGWTQLAYPANAVTSVHGRTGSVVAVSTDYSATGLSNTAIGASTPGTGAFTTLSATIGFTTNGPIPANQTSSISVDQLSSTVSRILAWGPDTSTPGQLQIGTISSNASAGANPVATFASTGLAVTGTLSATGAITSTAASNQFLANGSSQGQITLQKGALQSVSIGSDLAGEMFFYGATEYGRWTTAGLAVTGALNSNGAFSSTAATSVNSAFKGSLNAIRLHSETGGYFIEAVDPTLVSGYQPLALGGTTTTILSSSVPVGVFSATGLAVTGAISASGNIQVGVNLGFNGGVNEAIAYSASAIKTYIGGNPITAVSSTGLAVTGTIGCSSAAPASASAAGVAGTITWDASYVYVCVATNTWKRTAIATW